MTVTAADDDLIARLRRRDSDLAQAAADEIERLREELTRRDRAVLDGGGQARRDDPKTSKVASAAGLFSKQNLRRRLLEAYAAAYPEGLTAWEACQAVSEVKNTASPMRRVYDLYRPLADLGGRPMCEPTGETRPGQSGTPMRVHRLTEEGLLWLSIHAR